jgi:glycosyltransferase involved in cell wall biosynthesis
MRIAILGPIYTEKYFGGVATFDENLAIAYKKISNQNEVFLYSEQISQKRENLYGIKIYPISILAAFKQEAFDLMIASLDYAKYLPFIKAKKKIYFLHGFFSLSSYSALKTIFAVAYQKLFLRYADCIIGNSQFTCFINQRIYNINYNGFVRLGVSYDYIRQLKQSKNIPKERNSLLFTGRLIETKKIGNIICAMKVLKEKANQKYLLRIVGDGDLKPWLMNYAEQYNLDVEFYDRVSQTEIVKFYQMSQMFISLNPAEPFGITFCEALLAGCKIICPNTGGQVEFLSEYPNMAKMIPNLRPETIAEAIESLADNDKQNLINIQDFSYENTAKSILKIVRENG